MEFYLLLKQLVLYYVSLLGVLNLGYIQYKDFCLSDSEEYIHKTWEGHVKSRKTGSRDCRKISMF